MDGVETLVSLRMQLHGKNSDTPVVCLTANAVSGAREWYLERGFNDYLTKPVRGEQLEAMLLKYLPPERVTTSDAGASRDESDGALPAWLLSSEAMGNVLDVEAGLQFCGSAEDYLAVLRVFQESAAEKADEIQRLFEAKDWKNYTTKVHALKSSARVIGAAELSDRAALVIANLLIEYIGYPAFTGVIRKVNPEYVSCVIQINTDEKNWVSDSPWLHAFDGLDRVHHQMEESALTAAMKEAGYTGILRAEEALPNGKALVRLDYRRTGKG